MKTIKTFFAILMITISLSGYSQSLTVDVNNSIVKWHGKKVTGEHFGTIHLKSGNLVLENGKISAGEFIIDMTSIKNTDIDDADYKAKLEGHLKSDDFFGVNKFTTAKLVITKSSVFKNKAATVEAKLTIKNITQDIEFSVKKEDSKFIAEIVIDRSKFDVRYGSGSFFDNLGDKMIHDDFTLTIVLHTTK